MEHVPWTRMADGNAADYRMLTDRYEAHATETLVPNLIGLLRLLEGPKLGYQIDRYQHSLQSASRAMRNDESVDLVVGALLHDIGDGFAPENHSAAAAAIIEPFVDEETHWVVKHHGLFQGYYYFHHMGGDRNARELYRSAPHFEACARFCELYDQNCFDPDYPTLQIEDFLPALTEVFSRPSRLPDYAPIVESDTIGQPGA
ncbi:MAG: HD domain-containing protein [Actinomycetota bacterium]